jgi:hypothetical protein
MTVYSLTEIFSIGLSIRMINVNCHRMLELNKEIQFCVKNSSMAENIIEFRSEIITICVAVTASISLPVNLLALKTASRSQSVQ